MKKILVSLFVFALAISLNAQTVPTDQQLIRTSGFSVHAAHKAVLSNGVYTGNFAKCVEHQRYAVDQFKRGEKTTAVYHAAYARRLALLVIKANNSKPHPSFEFTADENAIITGSPSDSEMDSSVFKGGAAPKDEDYLDSHLTGIDL